MLPFCTWTQAPARNSTTCGKLAAVLEKIIQSARQRSYLFTKHHLGYQLKVLKYGDVAAWLRDTPLFNAIRLEECATPLRTRRRRSTAYAATSFKPMWTLLVFDLSKDRRWLPAKLESVQATWDDAVQCARHGDVDMLMSTLRDDLSAQRATILEVTEWLPFVQNGIHLWPTRKLVPELSTIVDKSMRAMKLSEVKDRMEVRGDFDGV